MGTFREPAQKAIVEVVLVEDDLVTEVAAIEILPGKLARFILTIDDKMIVDECPVQIRRTKRKIVLPIEAVLPAIWLASSTLGRYWTSRLPENVPMLA